MADVEGRIVNDAPLTSVSLARQIRDGLVDAEEVVRACLGRIDEAEEDVQAWAHLDADYAIQQAQQLDAIRGAADVVGPLHGLPVGVKDIFDTADLPTENGTVLDAGRQPEDDASVVSQLKEAGAVILGKTVTTELAVYAPGKTRNPHNPAHTPGGSSSGSAAAVAAGMVPLAVGTQTNGSTIRPAAYCGVFGFKPTHGLISRTGVLEQSRALDTVGVFGRSVEDIALLAQSITGYDEADPDSRVRARPRLLEVAGEEPPLDPMFAFVKSPVWETATEETRAAFAELSSFLGEQCDEVPLPDPFEQALDCHRTILCADLAKSFAHYHRAGADRLSETLREMIEEGQKILAVDYNRAIDWVAVLNAGLDQIFDRYDAILTPATAGTAPSGLESTGSPAFCTLWTLCGTPAITVPLMQGSDGLPLGVQLVGRRGDDARLLRTARWLTAHVEAAEA